ncbi:hypothetical protein D3C71_1233140 [compost metagenome]
MCKGGTCGCHDFFVCRLGAPVADVVHGRCRENHGVLRHGARVQAQGFQAQLADVHTVEADGTLGLALCLGVHVVKALQQLEHRGFARAAGAHQRHRFARRQVKRKVLQRGLVGARGVVEPHVLKLHLQPPFRHRQFLRRDRVYHGRSGREQFHQPLRGARSAQQIAIDLAQHGHGTGQQDHIHHGLPQMPGCHLARQHRLRAPVQPPEQQCGVCNDDEGHEKGAGPGALDGDLERVLGGLHEAGGLARFCRVALHHRHGIEHLGRDGAGIGHPVLAVARQAPHAPADPHGG